MALTRQRRRLEINRLPAARVPEAEALLVRAYHGDPNFVDLFPDPARRVRALHAVFRGMWVDTEPYGTIYGAEVDGKLAGSRRLASAWRLSHVDSRRLRAAPHLLRALITAPRSARRLVEYLQAGLALHPDAPAHWYLEALAVDEDERDRGMGRRLLEVVLHHADERGEPCYLETGSRSTVDWYGRLGFGVIRDAVQLVDGGPPNWTMCGARLGPRRRGPPRRRPKSGPECARCSRAGPRAHRLVEALRRHRRSRRPVVLGRGGPTARVRRGQWRGQDQAMRIVIGVLAADAGEVRWRGRAIDREACRQSGRLDPPSMMSCRHAPCRVALSAAIRQPSASWQAAAEIETAAPSAHRRSRAPKRRPAPR